MQEADYLLDVAVVQQTCFKHCFGVFGVDVVLTVGHWHLVGPEQHKKVNIDSQKAISKLEDSALFEVLAAVHRRFLSTFPS